MRCSMGHAMKRGLAAANAGADPDAQLCMRRGVLMPCAQIAFCAAHHCGCRGLCQCCAACRRKDAAPVSGHLRHELTRSVLVQPGCVAGH